MKLKFVLNACLMIACVFLLNMAYAEVKSLDNSIDDYNEPNSIDVQLIEEEATEIQRYSNKLIASVYN